ncbi:MAG: ribosome biogenesis GTPase Der [Myxococcota bacterium]
MSRTSNLPIVAIVGRPNVGKSTLFNRFAGVRRALVEDVPGITRDRIAAEIEVGARRVLIVDTAGLDGEAEEGLHGAVQQQARSAISEADAVLFLVDGKSGLLPEDESLARTLRQTSKPVTLAVNKIDRPQHQSRISEFYGLGFENTRGISAEHATGAWDALEELVEQISEIREPEPVRDEGIRIAIVGPPNVGKSSLLNRLVGEDRVVVSDIPGTTRDAIDTLVVQGDQRFTLIDTAGLRKQGRRTRTAERGSALMTVRALERAQIAFIVIDANEGFRAQDATIASLAQERGCATVVLANKWDLVAKGGPDRAKEVREAIQRGLRFLADAPLCQISATTGAGVGRLLERAQKLQQTAERRIPTAELNRWLQDCVRRHEPAMAQRGQRKRPLKFFYATQTTVRPPTFVLVCTDPNSVQPSYRRFLENRLRESFGFDGIPIRLRLRPRSRKNDRE